MEQESNDENGQQAEQTPAKKPYKAPALADYGAATEETKVGHQHHAALDHGSS
jgi:hypothetical protein